MSVLSKALAVAGAVSLLCIASDASAQMADRKALTLEAAKKISAAAEAEAKKNNWTVAIAIVDDAGHLLHYVRIDETQPGSNVFAIEKARTSALYKRPTKAMEDVVAGGRHVVMTFPGATPVQGGLPLMWEGKVVGAIGVSGVTSQQDEQIAKAGVDALK